MNIEICKNCKYKKFLSFSFRYRYKLGTYQYLNDFDCYSFEAYQDVDTSKEIINCHLDYNNQWRCYYDNNKFLNHKFNNNYINKLFEKYKVIKDCPYCFEHEIFNLNKEK